MDPREQIGDHTEALSTMLDGRQASIWTMMPGIVQSFKPAEMTCVVQIALKGQHTKKDGTIEQVTIANLVDCPILFPSGGGWTLTFYPQKDDECCVFFASRCIDAWWQSGGIQQQQEFRMHTLSDGFVLIGPRSKPNVISNIKEHAVQLRADDGMTYIEINQDQIVKIAAPGNIDLNGVIIDSDGNVTAPGDVLAGGDDGISLMDHVHGGVQSGSSDTGPPE